jgi:leader peptidase (prepilin peptidase)/N-methyltransferase
LPGLSALREIYAFSAFVLGLLIGSFLNVVIHRLPRGESIIAPGSRCPACGAPVRPFDNLPVLSYLLLGGRCRDCRARISPRYPLIELATGILFFALVATAPSGAAALVEMWFVATLIALIAIDARIQLLPDQIIYPAFAICLALPLLDGPPIDLEMIDAWQSATAIIPSPHAEAALGAVLILLAVPFLWVIDQLDVVLFTKYHEWAEGDQSEDDGVPEVDYPGLLRRTFFLSLLLATVWIASIESGWIDPLDHLSMLIAAWTGALAGAISLWLIRAIYFYLRGIEGLGLGDIKLVAVIGAFFGWRMMIIVIMLGSLTGTIAGLILVSRKDGGRRTRISFGLYLGLAAILVIFLERFLMKVL